VEKMNVEATKQNQIKRACTDAAWVNGSRHKIVHVKIASSKLCLSLHVPLVRSLWLCFDSILIYLSIPYPFINRD
jgi:hypothetical protein